VREKPRLFTATGGSPARPVATNGDPTSLKLDSGKPGAKNPEKSNFFSSKPRGKFGRKMASEEPSERGGNEWETHSPKRGKQEDPAASQTEAKSREKQRMENSEKFLATQVTKANDQSPETMAKSKQSPETMAINDRKP
jgi:hypothetical protein